MFASKLKAILRSTGAILLSLVLALILLIAIEGISTVLHPFPPGFGNTPEEMLAHVANYPAWVLVLLAVVGWGLTMFASTWLATRLGTHRHPAHGIGVGLLLLAAAVFNMSMLPYPVWFEVLDLLVLPACLYLGLRLARPPGDFSPTG